VDFTDEAFGGYEDGPTSDGTRFIALCLAFDVGHKELKFFHATNLDTRIIPLAQGAPGTTIEVFGFSSNTTNAHWSHAQNRNLALDRMQATADHIIQGGVAGTRVTDNFADSGETGDEGSELSLDRFTMIVVTLNGATPPAPQP
jgi:hypothetical protein